MTSVLLPKVDFYDSVLFFWRIIYLFRGGVHAHFKACMNRSKDNFSGVISVFPPCVLRQGLLLFLLLYCIVKLPGDFPCLCLPSGLGVLRLRLHTPHLAFLHGLWGSNSCQKPCTVSTFTVELSHWPLFSS